MLFSHITVGSNDLDRSKKFYDALFKVIGNTTITSDDKGRLFYGKDGQLLLITRPIDGKAATVGNGGTIGFMLPSENAVDEWHDAGLKYGGTSIENPPGIRESRGAKRYLAYLRDPDGNKLCAYYLVQE